MLFHVYPSAARPGTSTATLATWRVPDVDLVVDQLRSRGVSVQQYEDSPLDTDEQGIHTMTDGKIAWFRDAEGNTFAIERSLTGDQERTAC